MITNLASNRGLEPETPRALAALSEASAELLAARALLTRVDRKYLLPREATADLRMYDDHRRGRCPRYKVRIRHHIDRELSFLEVKRKGANRQTTKAILNRPFGVAGLDPEDRHFIDQHCPMTAAGLVPALTVDFLRATLVGDVVNERVTVDWDLDFHQAATDTRLAQAVIVEVKQARYSNHTPAIRALRALRMREQSISKYCIATAAGAAVRGNTFKPALRAVERLSVHE
jgi:hypothetical protein